MSDAYVVETPSHTAGIAVREEQGFRFYASHRAVFRLDRKLFSHMRQLRRAVDEAIEAAAQADNPSS